MRIALNGFGRIGRTILRQIIADPGGRDIDIALINDIAPAETLAYLLRYDSTFGPFHGALELDGQQLRVAGRTIPVSQSDTCAALDLSDVDVFLECTGKAKSSDAAAEGLRRGANKVLVSGPCPGAEATVVLGANDAELAGRRVVSAASCTTNAIAPLMRAVDEGFALTAGHVTTVHCYTNSQPLVDNPRDSLSRSRAAALSMVPTTTSATALVGEVLPGLANKLTGAALRVPTASVSCIDAVLSFDHGLPQDLNGWLQTMARGSAVIDATEDPVVSCDMRAKPASLVLALPETKRISDHQARLFGWYDNEWGFAARMIDMARAMAR